LEAEPNRRSPTILRRLAGSDLATAQAQMSMHALLGPKDASMVITRQMKMNKTISTIALINIIEGNWDSAFYFVRDVHFHNRAIEGLRGWGRDTL
jgi:hypothetical protein